MIQVLILMVVVLDFFPEISATVHKDATIFSSFFLHNFTKAGGVSTHTSSFNSFSTGRTTSSKNSTPSSFVVRPSQGGGVIFPPNLLHEGIPITRGRRHLIAVFTKDGSNHTSAEKSRIRKEQYDAARSIQLQAALHHTFCEYPIPLTPTSTPNFNHHPRRSVSKYYAPSSKKQLDITICSPHSSISSVSATTCFTKPTPTPS
mmetsp:Transcript_3912/g.5984  ORF Transcript_3912/g.5984 Transcript_3912/m.5984 type:complete len:203 (+) Transcript_3912:581-1189(+)